MGGNNVSIDVENLFSRHITQYQTVSSQKILELTHFTCSKLKLNLSMSQ